MAEARAEPDGVVRRMLKARDDHAATAQRLGSAEYAYLRSRGWRHTCSLPGSFWGWEKEMPDGRWVFVPESMAMKIQESMTPEDFEDEDAV